MRQYKHVRTGVVLSTNSTVNAPEWVEITHSEPVQETEQPVETNKGGRKGGSVRKSK